MSANEQYERNIGDANLWLDENDRSIQAMVDVTCLLDFTLSGTATAGLGMPSDTRTAGNLAVLALMGNQRHKIWRLTTERAWHIGWRIPTLLSMAM